MASFQRNICSLITAFCLKSDFLIQHFFKVIATNMSKSRLIVTLCVLLVIVLAEESNETLLKMTIQDSKCTFYYTDSNETGFLFSSCSKANKDIDDWTSCLHACCPDLSANIYRPSLYALQRCNQGDSLSGGEKALIVMAAVGTTVAVVVTCCFLIITFKCCKLYGFRGRVNIDPIIAISSVEW